MIARYTDGNLFLEEDCLVFYPTPTLSMHLGETPASYIVATRMYVNASAIVPSPFSPWSFLVNDLSSLSTTVWMGRDNKRVLPDPFLKFFSPTSLSYVDPYHYRVVVTDTFGEELYRFSTVDIPVYACEANGRVLVFCERDGKLYLDGGSTEICPSPKRRIYHVEDTLYVDEIEISLSKCH
jgi:hypothetical protein